MSAICGVACSNELCWCGLAAGHEDEFHRCASCSEEYINPPGWQSLVRAQSALARLRYAHLHPGPAQADLATLRLG